MPINNNRQHVLITRPEEKGRPLAQQLETIGISASCQSFFDYQQIVNQQAISTNLKINSPDIIIFISSAAVNFANQALPIKTWAKLTHHKNIQFFTVGQATKNALEVCDIRSVICPELHTSEGLLRLDALSSVFNKNILIVRGDGGREHLYTELSERGAKVNYLESYQRVWRTFSDNIVKQWQVAKISAIVITSNALLQRIVDIITAFLDTLTQEEKLPFTHWLTTCTWVVASERIANNARALGLHKVINANGANDQAIIKVLT